MGQKQFCYCDGAKYHGTIRAQKLKIPNRLTKELGSKQHPDEIQANAKQNVKTASFIDQREEVWEVLMYKRGDALFQWPEGLKAFCFGLFSQQSTSGYGLMKIDEEQMKEFVAGVPMPKEAKDEAMHNFKLALVSWRNGYLSYQLREIVLSNTN